MLCALDIWTKREKSSIGYAKCLKRYIVYIYIIIVYLIEHLLNVQVQRIFMTSMHTW